MEVRIISNIAKVYPNMIQILIYKDPKSIVVGTPRYGRRQKPDVFVPSERSVSRTRNNLSDIVKCNNFELFCTFTFDRRKVDRYSLNSCYRVMSTWLHSQQIKANGDLRYVVVPERHKDGALHFHALISGLKTPLKDSGHVQNGRTIYNIPGYRSGFSTAVKIDNIDKVSSYIRKYITKDMIKEFGRRRYFCSRNLIRPTKVVNSNYFKNCLPLGRKHIADCGEFDIYELDPHFFQKVLDK